MPRFPPRGSHGRLFPRFNGTIKALRLPAGPPAAFRFLHLAVPRDHAIFAPAIATCGNVRPGVGHPVSPTGLLPWRRQDLPSSWGTPIPVCTWSPTPAGRNVPDQLRDARMAPAKCTTKAPTRRLSRLNSTAFGLAAYVSRDGYPPDRARLASRCWSLSWTGFYPQSSCKRFQLTSCLSLSFFKLLGTNTFSSQRCPSHHACKSPSQIPNVAHHITPAKVRRKYQTLPITSRLQKSVANTNRRFRRAAAFRLLRGVVRTPAPSSPARIACIEFPRN